MSLYGIKLSFKASPPTQGQMQTPHRGLQVWHHLDLAHLFAIITPTWSFLFLEHNSPAHWGLLTGLQAVHRQLFLHSDSQGKYHHHWETSLDHLI